MFGMSSTSTGQAPHVPTLVAAVVLIIIVVFVYHFVAKKL